MKSAKSRHESYSKTGEGVTYRYCLATYILMNSTIYKRRHGSTLGLPGGNMEMWSYWSEASQ